MQIDKIYQKKMFLDEGYFVYKKLIDKNFIKKILDEISTSKDTIKYFDNKNNLRRIEKLFDKGISLKGLNNKILIILKDIFEEEFVIFKDKFNAKPPGGEGFFAHFDGVFNFKNENDIKKNGWYEYGNFFINVLIALDECNEYNGTIELSKIHNGNFHDLLSKTKNDGTPALNKKTEDMIFFNPVNLEAGDIVIFSNKCPHRSRKNNSNKNRRILYYTYTPLVNGSKYNQYFIDKEKSKNPSKALVDKKE
jgi:ectoine hydroxylase-related dioxygenase (phytanoyl-CoA dioxygenase family)